MFRFASIQSKIGGVLTVILIVTIGISVGLVGALSHHQLKSQQEDALVAAHDAALGQARSTFQSLELGTSGSLEQGEMEAFEELLVGLGEVPGVNEVGLADPAGTAAARLGGICIFFTQCRWCHLLISSPPTNI